MKKNGKSLADRARSMFRRTEEEKILNNGEAVTVGGAGPKSDAKIVIVREPTWEMMERMVSDIFASIELYQDLVPQVAQKLRGDPTNWLQYLQEFHPIRDKFHALLGKIVGESGEWVRTEMGVGQMRKLVETWIRVVNIEEWRDLFLSVRERVKGVREETIDPARAQSSPSPGSPASAPTE